MKFKIKAIKSGVWVLGDSKLSVKNGVQFLKDNTKFDVVPLETKATGLFDTDEAFMCKVIFGKV